MAERFRLSFCGNSNVGKSQIIRRIFGNSYRKEYKVNPGTYFFKRNFSKYPCTVLDTQGFKTISDFNESVFDLYYDVMLLIAVYSVDNNSFPQVQMILKDMKSRKLKIPVILVCNKIDLASKDQDRVRKKIGKGRKLAEAHKLQFFMTSAKDELNIDNLEDAINEHVEKYKKELKKKVVALYDFDAESKDELSFKEGDVLKIIKDGKEWMTCELTVLGKTTKGLVPTAYVERAVKKGGKK